MTLQDVIRDRRIEEILHFTTNKGLIGILDSGSVLSRERIHANERLEHILTPNTPIVKDAGWIDYVNLSITRINTELFQISSGRWHQDVWWAILAFNPVILTHKGVYFVTANNIWPRARRAGGAEGLEALFAPKVIWSFR